LSKRGQFSPCLQKFQLLSCWNLEGNSRWYCWPRAISTHYYRITSFKPLPIAYLNCYVSNNVQCAVYNVQFTNEKYLVHVNAKTFAIFYKITNRNVRILFCQRRSKVRNPEAYNSLALTLTGEQEQEHKPIQLILNDSVKSKFMKWKIYSTKLKIAIEKINYSWINQYLNRRYNRVPYETIHFQ
jgi:hypothetical protein